MSASHDEKAQIHRCHIDAEDGDIVHLTVNDADYFIGAGSNTVLLPQACEPILLDTEDPGIDVPALIWRRPRRHTEPPYYRFATDLDEQINQAVSAVLDIEGEEEGPVTDSERLDNEQEQRLGHLTAAVLGELFLTRTPLIPVGHAAIVDDVCVDDFRDGEGLLDGLAIVPYLSLSTDETTLLTKGPQLFIDGIRRSTDLDGATVLRDQLRAFARTVLGQVVYALNRQLDFYRTALPRPATQALTSQKEDL